MPLVTPSLLGKEPWQLVPKPSQPPLSPRLHQSDGESNEDESDDEDLPPVPSPLKGKDPAVSEALERQSEVLERQRKAREAAESILSGMEARLRNLRVPQAPPLNGFPPSTFPVFFPGDPRTEALVQPFDLVYAEERVLNHLCALGASDLETSLALSHTPSKFTLMGAIYGYTPLEDTDFTLPRAYTTTRWEKLDSTEGIFESWLESIRVSISRLERAFMLIGKLFLSRSERGKGAKIWTELVVAQIGQILILPFNPPKTKPHLLAMYEIMEASDMDQWEARVEVYVIDNNIIEVEQDDVDAVSYGSGYGGKRYGD